MLNLIKIETTTSTPAYINPDQVVSVITARQSGTRDNCVKVALVNGDYVETPWTYAKVISALTQVVYDPVSDPDVPKNTVPAEVKNESNNFFQLVPQLVDRLLRSPETALHAAAIAFRDSNNLRDSSIKFWFPVSQNRLAFVTLIENASHTWGLDIYLGTMDDASDCALRHNIGGRTNKPLTCCVSDAESIYNALIEVAARM